MLSGLPASPRVAGESDFRVVKSRSSAAARTSVSGVRISSSGLGTVPYLARRGHEHGMEVGMSYTCLDVARAAQLLPGPIRGAEHSFHCPGLSHTGGDKHPSLLINVTKNCYMC